MVTREYFKETLEKYIKKRRDFDIWFDKLEEVLRPAPEAIYNHTYEDEFIDLLAHVLNDKYEWLSYFVYERDCNWFSYEFKGEEIEIDSLDKLYDLITEGSEDES